MALLLHKRTLLQDLVFKQISRLPLKPTFELLLDYFIFRGFLVLWPTQAITNSNSSPSHENRVTIGTNLREAHGAPQNPQRPHRTLWKTLTEASDLHVQYDWTTGVADNGNEWPCCTSLTPLASPFFLLSLIGLETEGLLDYKGRAGVISILQWNLRLLVFAVDLRIFLRSKFPQEALGGLRHSDDYPS